MSQPHRPERHNPGTLDQIPNLLPQHQLPLTIAVEQVNSTEVNTRSTGLLMQRSGSGPGTGTCTERYTRLSGRQGFEDSVDNVSVVNLSDGSNPRAYRRGSNKTMHSAPPTQLPSWFP